MGGKKTICAKMITRRSAALRAVIMSLTVTAASMLSGFADGSMTGEDDHGLTPLIERRTVAIQRFLFKNDDKHSNNGKQTLFSELSEVETYPVLSDDFSITVSFGDTDCDRVINMKIEDVDCKAHTRSYGIYNVDIKWYMSGYTGYYTENGSYRIRTSIVNGRQYIAEFTPV